LFKNRSLRPIGIRLAVAAFFAVFVVGGSQALAVPTGTASTSWDPNPPTRPSVGQTVTFTVTPTWDGAEGTAVWNFGDGATATGLSVTHAYGTAGPKGATVTLTNGDVPAEVSDAIPVLVVVNAVPVAGFSWSPLGAITGQDVRFVSNSDDAGGGIAQYQWDFGDGVTDERPSPVHPFGSSGIKRVTLTVTDAYGATDTEMHDILVQDPVIVGAPPNKPPVATFVFGPRSPRVGDPVEFSSSAIDPEGKLRSQTWDLDGDGQFDDARGDDVVYTFVRPGEQTVRLRVEDEGGAAAVRERTVTVQAKPRARAGFLNPSPVISLNGQILGNGSRIKLLRVRGPNKALVTVRCKGKSCPAPHRRKRIKGSSVRFKTYERFLRAGVKVEILVRKPSMIGSYTRYTIRAKKFPKRVNRCLPPGSEKPQRRCT
jgi:PKD repeat protein